MGGLKHPNRKFVCMYIWVCFYVMLSLTENYKCLTAQNVCSFLWLNHRDMSLGLLQRHPLTLHQHLSLATTCAAAYTPGWISFFRKLLNFFLHCSLFNHTYDSFYSETYRIRVHRVVTGKFQISLPDKKWRKYKENAVIISKALKHIIWIGAHNIHMLTEFATGPSSCTIGRHILYVAVL